MEEVIDAKLNGSDVKRPHLETRGRRLFSPQASTSNEFNHLSTILEELHSPPNNNTNFLNLSPSKRNSLVKRQLNIIKSPENKVYPSSPLQGDYCYNCYNFFIKINLNHNFFFQF